MARSPLAAVALCVALAAAAFAQYDEPVFGEDMELAGQLPAWEQRAGRERQWQPQEGYEQRGNSEQLGQETQQTQQSEQLTQETQQYEQAVRPRDGGQVPLPPGEGLIQQSSRYQDNQKPEKEQAQPFTAEPVPVAPTAAPGGGYAPVDARNPGTVPSGYPSTPGVPKGYEPAPSKNNPTGFYKVHVDSKTWDAALMTCVSEGAELVVPKTEQEAKVVGALYNKTKKNVKKSEDRNLFFIGASDLAKENIFVTLLGTQLGKNNWHRWQKGEPNNHKKNEHCVLSNDQAYYWDGNCQAKYAFICRFKENPCNPIVPLPYNTQIQQSSNSQQSNQDNQQWNSQQPNSQQPNSQQPNSQQPNSQQPNYQQPNYQQPSQGQSQNFQQQNTGY